MAGEHGKNRENDFAYWANLGGKRDLSDDDINGLLGQLGVRRYVDGLDDKQALDVALIQCENLYRVACLLAYGNGLASVEDISSFARIFDIPNPYYDPVISPDEGYDEPTIAKVEVLLPFTRWCDEAIIPDILATPREHRPGLNPVEFPFSDVEYSAYVGKRYQSFCMSYYIGAPLSSGLDAESIREPFRFIGQTIANAQTFRNYVGLINGKPRFEPGCGFDYSWQTMAELTNRQAPGICPVCGKVVDRRRDKKGGHPKKTCLDHSDKFQNMKKALRNGTDPIMKDDDKCQEAVRRQRWFETNLNERPLRFIADAGYRRQR